MSNLYKYGVAVHLYKPVIKRAVVDFAVGADWTPAAGDVKISKDGGAAANVTNLPTAITMGNTAMWDFSLTAAEMQAKLVRITVSDSATKAVEDVMFELDTYGDANAQHAVDFNDAVRAGLTALPNAAAEAAGGLYTRGAGAGQIAQDANGRVNVNLLAILGTTLTETAGQIAAGFKKFFNVAAPTAQADNLPLNTDYTAARATKLDNLDATVSSRLATAGYTAPPSAAAIRIEIDANSTGLAAIFARTDVATSTRLASAGYTAPDNASIATILTRTDVATSTRAVAGDAMTLTAAGRQAVADSLLGRRVNGGADGGRTVGQALAVLRNKVEVAAGILTVYDIDDVTPLFTAAVTTAPGNPVSVIDPA